MPGTSPNATGSTGVKGSSFKQVERLAVCGSVVTREGTKNSMHVEPSSPMRTRYSHAVDLEIPVIRVVDPSWLMLGGDGPTPLRDPLLQAMKPMRTRTMDGNIAALYRLKVTTCQEQTARHRGTSLRADLGQSCRACSAQYTYPRLPSRLLFASAVP